MPSGSSFERYLAVETAGGAVWHPDKKRIAFAYNAPGFYQIYTADITRGKPLWPTRLTFEDDRCTDPHYLSDGTLMFARDYGGDENFQFGLIDGYDMQWISDDLEAKHEFAHATENAIYYIANIEDKSRLDIYRRRIPLSSSEPELLFKPDEGIVIPRTPSPDDSKVILDKYRGNVDQELLLLDTEEETVRSLTGELSKGKSVRWESARWIDSDTLVVMSDLESDKRRLGVLSLHGTFKLIEDTDPPLEHEVEEIAYANGDPFTYFTENVEGYSEIYRGKFQKDGSIEDLERINPPLKGVVESGDARSFLSGLSVSPDGDYLALTLSAPNKPTNVWVVELDDRLAWKATDVNTAGLDPNSFVDASLENYESFDTLTVPYFRYLPEGQMPENGWPAILVIHGGPESQIRPGFSPVIQFMLSSGYAVIAPNIRGSTGYGRKYMDLDNVEKRLDSTHDIQQLASHLKTDVESINGDKLIIYGGSYGGFAVLSSITEYPDLWTAAVDIVGISNFVTFLENTADWRRSLREAEYGSLEDDREILEQISPIHKVDKIECPLFIIQGENDERVPLSESIQIYEEVKAKGIPVELLRYPDEGHGLSKLKNRIDAYSQVLDWLNDIVTK
ncbi:MAG: prolyl oligopeptidase family serine peptidase [Candidatus Lokiarchaeota archaeon]|nr:prolyl oligopeptidase family serine peptidase [Candidatus Lokiarchaeota archaeon]